MPILRYSSDASRVLRLSYISADGMPIRVNYRQQRLALSSSSLFGTLLRNLSRFADFSGIAGFIVPRTADITIMQLATVPRFLYDCHASGGI